MSKIHQNNFIDYLFFLGKKYPKMVLSNEKTQKLKQINDQQIVQYLQLLYTKFGLDGKAEERDFINSKIEPEVVQAIPVILPSILPSKSENPQPVKITTIPIEVIEEPVKSPLSEVSPSEVSPSGTLPSEVLPVKVSPIAVSPDEVSINKTLANVLPPGREYPVKVPPKRNTFRNIMIVVLLSITAFIVYKYYNYQKLGFIYVLTDELLVRTSYDKTGKVMGSMNLFGKTKDKNNNGLPTPSSLRLYANEKQGAYFKVIMSETPFFSYLLDLDDVGYVYSKFVTTSKPEQDLYRKIFEPIKEDYYELKNLEFAYRTIIVNAITTVPPLSSLVVKESCDLQSVSAKNMPLRIGQYQNKDRTVFYVLVQLSDNNYYSIEADGFYNVLKVRPMYLDNELFSMEGKFSNKGDYFVWESCDRNIHAQSSGYPFDEFETL